MPFLLDKHITEFKYMKSYPKHIYYRGDEDLLNRQKVSVVGTRRPSGYTKSIVMQITSSLASRGVVIVSGAAMGVDAVAHNGAGYSSTIAVMGCGIKHRYPKINSNLIESIETKGGLVLSQFDPDFIATPWSFVVRNELVVALGEVLIVAEADLNSGTMRSVEYAKKMGKPIFVIPHRLGESKGTNALLESKDAEAIYDIDKFVSSFGVLSKSQKEDTFIQYCRKSPSYEDAMKKFGQKVFEAELEGIIAVKDGRIVIL
ncbi:DNA-processing protein DprA [Hydrogenimonas thermophila]|uniref:DNA processing protein n=1 Tax=Hydrogenimonas thermophila TaxID=223786 RepID=A0A1I5MKY6_9BACT|nr:DNA processing protein [Hydrogenimonas thermophila]